MSPDAAARALGETLAGRGLRVRVEASGPLAVLVAPPDQSVDWPALRADVVRLAREAGFSHVAVELRQVRLFVALDLPPDVRAHAWRATAPLRDALPSGVAWVREEALHVTLRFLGEQPETVVGDLAARLAPRLAERTPPRVRLDAVGAFPSLRRPRVLWLGGPANSGVAELYHDVQRACASLGFDPEERPFKLHVTVGRVRQGARVDPELLARAAAEVRLRAELTVSTVDVMESELTPAGARYRVVAAVHIGPRG